MTSTTRPGAVITGAASGLGRALALDIARRGGRVVVADIDRSGADETAGLVDNAGGRASVILCDVRDANAVDELAQRSEEWLGAVDLVANNAGVAVSGAFEDIPLDDWRWIVDINLWGVIHGCRAFYPAMKQRGHGHILNVASVAGLVSMPLMAPYNLTKAGVVALSETLHSEARRHGVHVTVLCPTFFATNIIHSARDSISSESRERIERIMKRARTQAPDVARYAIDATLAGRLYALPMRDGRMVWRLERTMPGIFYRFLRGPVMAILDRFDDRSPRRS